MNLIALTSLGLLKMSQPHHW